MALSNSLIQQINKLSSGGAWIMLLEVVVSDSITVYLCSNIDNVEFGGNTYVPFGFEIEDTKQDLKGGVPTIRLRVSNVTRFMQSYLETYNGGVDFTVNIKVVNSEYLNEDYTDLDMSFDVLGSESDEKWVIFTLGSPSPLRHRFPRDRYLARYCRFVFKSVECGYSGDETTCARSLDDCRVRGNSVRFGGFPGLISRAMRVV